ncbi:MAG: GEVED domain-containing protein, partial [Candidatus Kapaibacterium sp.]
MKKHFIDRITTSILAIVFVLIAIPSGKADAQYCELGSQMYGWLEVGSIHRVTITDLTEGTLVYERKSGWEQWATIDVTGTSSNPIELNIGNNFEISVNWGIYYQGYLRIYLDRNSDGRFDYVQMGPEQEFIGWAFKTDNMYYIPPIEYIDTKFPFIVSDNIQEGPSMLRVVTNYYQLNTDPCTIYYMPNYLGYGEAEDYSVKFVAALPEVYPTTDNILFNKERYDGTTRNYNGVPTTFKLPAVEFKGPQPTGTQIEYWITGPLPSRDVVYRALDPNTG